MCFLSVKTFLKWENQVSRISEYMSGGELHWFNIMVYPEGVWIPMTWTMWSTHAHTESSTVELPPVSTVWQNFMSYFAVSMAIKQRVLYWQLSHEENDVLAMTRGEYLLQENKQQHCPQGCLTSVWPDLFSSNLCGYWPASCQPLFASHQITDAGGCQAL